MSPAEPHDLIDRSLKVLIRHAYPAFLQLAGISADPATVTLSDAAVNLSEFRGDRLLLIGREDDPDRWGWYVEFQLQPDVRVLEGWLLKHAAFNAWSAFSVILTVIYLTPGDRATFPDSYTISGGGLENRYSFHTIRLWEHVKAIRDGTLAELAPLLALCEEPPTEATLQRERELILGLDVPRPVRAELLAVAAMVGLRWFSRELLRTIFREEIEMLQEAEEFARELWPKVFEEKDALAEARGEARGEAQAAHRLVLRQLRKRFGELPAEVVSRVGSADVAWCEELGERLLDATSLEELGLGADGHPTP